MEAELPVITVECFWCTDLHNIIDDVVKPVRVHLPNRYEPCPACKWFMNCGITVLETSEFPRDMPKIATTDLEPTGRWLVLPVERLSQFYTARGCGCDDLDDGEIDFVLMQQTHFMELLDFRVNTPGVESLN